MTTDLIERIDEWQSKQDSYDPVPWDLLCHARDEIERLTELLRYEREIAVHRWNIITRLQAEIDQWHKTHAAYEQAITKIEDEWHHG